jgi:hypothetical protein
MNQTQPSYDAMLMVLEGLGQDPHRAVTGVLMGSLLGGSIWLSLLSLALAG